MSLELGQIVLAATDAAANVGSGKISGGWEYVWASYIATWATLGLYGLSLWIRRPNAKAAVGGKS